MDPCRTLDPRLVKSLEAFEKQELRQLQHVDFRANMLTGDLKDLQTLKRLGWCCKGRRATIPWPRQLQYVDFAFNKQISGDLKDLQSLKLLG